MSDRTLKLSVVASSIPDTRIPVGREMPAATGRAIAFHAQRPSSAVTTGELIHADGDGGLVTIAGTGSGKGVSQVIPTLLTYPGTIVVTDPKGELYAVTARQRREMGQRVIRVDPFGTGDSQAINPFDLFSGRAASAVDDCARLASQMFPKTPGQMDPFWNDASCRIVAGSLLFIATHLTSTHRNLRTLRKMWFCPEADRVMFMACARNSTAHDGMIAEAAAMFVEAPDRTRASLLTTIRDGLGFLQSPGAIRGLSGDVMSLPDYIAGTPMTIYLTVPPHYLASHAKLLRIWLGTLINAATRRKNRPSVPDLLLVDEAAQPGYLEELRMAATLLRGYGVRTWTFWQSLAQIRQAYGESWMEFIDNASTMTMFGTSNAATESSVRDLTGYGGPILGMARDQQILVQSGMPAQKVRRLSYLQDPEYHGLWDANPLHQLPARKSRSRQAERSA